MSSWPVTRLRFLVFFKKYLELGTIAKVQEFLNENGYRTKEFVNKEGKKCSRKRWTNDSIHNLLTNLMYVGKREINKKKRSVDPATLSESEVYRAVDAQWPAIISTELFNAVQSLLEANKKRTRPYAHHYRLSGLTWCACGAKLFGKSGNGDGGKYFYYGHSRKLSTLDDRHLERCPLENLPAVALEEAVIARLNLLADDRKLLVSLLKSSEGSSNDQFENLGTLID